MEYTQSIKSILETSQETDYLLIVVSLFFCIISSFVLMHVYKHKSNSLSSKNQIAPIIPLISNITFLLIVIVKSSLALSLGLVGALSVIRFRTPIKEPEDLAFLFLAIGIGIGFGALQIYSTLIVFITIIILIWFFLSRQALGVTNDFNLTIEIDNSDKDLFDKILTVLKKNSNEVILKKIEKDENVTYLYDNVAFKAYENIKEIISDLNTNFPKSKFTIYESKVLD